MLIRITVWTGNITPVQQQHNNFYDDNDYDDGDDDNE
jgi:hypothetical protein